MYIFTYCLFSAVLICSQLISSTELKVISNEETPNQLNCTEKTKVDSSFCNKICNENSKLPYSSTFCDAISGSCVCDCRNTLKKKCVETPFTPCFQDCVRKNPNPDAYVYKGGNCPVPDQHGVITGNQCACECSIRDDYIETNEVY